MKRTGTSVQSIGFVIAAALSAFVVPVVPAWAQVSCARGDFEAVVDEAAESLRELNQTNKPTFQEKLRLLKDKRGWNHEQFLKAAAPFVQDDNIREYEQNSNRLLDRISAMGQEGSVAKAPDCKLLAELHGHMKALVEAQQAKWSYMFGKLDAELSK